MVGHWGTGSHTDFRRLLKDRAIYLTPITAAYNTCSVKGVLRTKYFCCKCFCCHLTIEEQKWFKKTLKGQYFILFIYLFILCVHVL